MSRAKDLEQRGMSKVEELTTQGAAKAQQLENKARNLQGGADSPKPLQEMSGRKGSPWRSE